MPDQRIGRRFLSARWQNLLMLNYPADPALLKPLVPPGTQLDSWNGKTFVSLVGFQFFDTRVLGVPIPFHQNFPEINLRFYVRRLSSEGWRRGVVFVKEIVPKSLIALVARWCYNENYVAFQMKANAQAASEVVGDNWQVSYAWQEHERWNSISAELSGTPIVAAPGTEEEFITEHYWGYVAQRTGAALEYRVEHPRWRVWRAARATLDCDVARCYGEQFSTALEAEPTSAFLADGSAITVYRGERLDQR
jgi:uncharacterized protein YqjF (DUF2071 family)